MTYREIYDAAMALLAEDQDELSSDYEERAPYILRTFVCECQDVDGGYRRLHGETGDEIEAVLPDLDDELPLSARFFSAGAYYTAAMLVENENDELCSRYFARYAAALTAIQNSPSVGELSSIRDVYGFRYGA